MSFLITSYIYPLEDKILLSEHFDFYLDNPRTKEEIAKVKSFLKKNYKSVDSFKIPVKFRDKELNEKFVTIESLIEMLRNTYYLKENIFTAFFDKHKNKSVFDLVARMWIIARFNNEKLNLEEPTNEFEQSLAGRMLDNLSSYTYLIALLIHTEGKHYFGRGFIYDKYLKTSFLGPWMDFMMFVSWCHHAPDAWKDDDSQWTYFPIFLKKLEMIRILLDKAFSYGLEEKMLYIGNLLKTSHDIREEKSRLLMLTSIIEMLLTHNPNTNRFNVEDSINKQFQLKTSILVYLNDKSRDINLIQKRLKTIYEQRSNVAHGNFNSLHKYIKNLSKKEGEEEFFDSLISDLYLYIRAILEEYLKDKKFVEFLKNN